MGWQYLVNNTKVQAQGGSANVVFDSLQRVGAGEFSVVLRTIPWVTFHVIDYGLDVWDGSTHTFDKLIADTHAAFFPEPSRRWTQFLEGSEIVTEGPNGPKSERYGFYPFAYPTHDPSGWQLSAVFNGIPALYTARGGRLRQDHGRQLLSRDEGWKGRRVEGTKGGRGNASPVFVPFHPLPSLHPFNPLSLHPLHTGAFP